MKLKQITIGGSAVLVLVTTAFGQEASARPAVPIYNVTVVERTTKAINYQPRSGPTLVDFKGTVLMPEAKGQAIVESKRGRTEIEVSIEKLLPSARFGAEYLTYTLWAITPEGAPHFADTFFHDALHRPTPAGMKHAHRVAFANNHDDR